MHSDAPANIPAGSNIGPQGASLTVIQQNHGIMAPPEIKQTLDNHLGSTAATQAGFGGGAPVVGV